MSYVEKAFWDYLKSTLFGGIRILLSRQFILFSVILFTISVATTGLVVMQEQASDLITQDLINYAFSIEISLAIGFILSGLVAKRLNFVTRLILMFLIVIKSLTIGSEFSFYYWIRDGKKYTDWYHTRPMYK